VPGDARRALLDEAARRGSDLIAAGARSQARIVRLLLGSVAEALVRRSPVDVLIVR
jgi:nucleotide-binding universal stress UspA family protein